MKRKTDRSAIDTEATAIGPETRWSQAAQRHYEPDETSELTVAVVFAIADAEGVSPKELKEPPLYECVDLPALEEAFFGPERDTGPQQGSGTVEFRYADYLVRVRSDGWISVLEPAETNVPE